MKKNLLALLAISAVLVAADNEKFIVELEKTSVTAQKFETNVRETSKNVTVISEDEIKKSGAKSVVDLLKTVPGLFVGTGFGSGTVDFRGQGESAKNNVLVLVNVSTVVYRMTDNSSADLQSPKNEVYFRL